jgi:hypothetical protein
MEVERSALKTHPAPDAVVDQLRILAYTCAGGYDGPPLNGQTIWLDMAARRRLLERALGFQPDVVIANGDQIYWDIRTVENKSEVFCDHLRRHWWGRFGTFDRSMPANRGDNDKILQPSVTIRSPVCTAARWSSFRKVNSTPSGTVDMDEALRPIEKNGFTIIDATPETMTFRLFVWPPQSGEEIDTMEPVMTFEVKTRN